MCTWLPTNGVATGAPEKTRGCPKRSPLCCAYAGLWALRWLLFGSGGAQRRTCIRRMSSHVGARHYSLVRVFMGVL